MKNMAMKDISMDQCSSLVTNNLSQAEEKHKQQCQRMAIYVVSKFLLEKGYSASFNAFTNETETSLNNPLNKSVNLEQILVEYRQYYYRVHNKYPKLWKTDETNRKDTDKEVNINVTKKTSKSEKRNNYEKGDISDDMINLSLTVNPLSSCIASASSTSVFFRKSLKPISGLYPANSEWFEIAKIIAQETVSRQLNVHWDDIKGQEEAKEVLQDTIIYPQKYPEIYTGKFSPPKGVLLHGPPGTGKTMLAKAVATECECTFFNITSSSIVSKWRGDSEKYVRVLFELAEYLAPTIIFMDEIDWISYTCDSEPAKRFRAEFLTRLDGLLSSDGSGVTILAATNALTSIDAALLRRLGRRVLVDLPNYSCRQEILLTYTTKEIANSLAEFVEGYSCADLKLLSKEAWGMYVRPLLKEIDKNTGKTKEILNAKEVPDIKYFFMAMNNIYQPPSKDKSK